jgi:transcriptional regulator with XRE-family HTH domain
MISKHPQCVSDWERGEALPSLEAATAIADALNVSLDYLTGRSEISDVAEFGRADPAAIPAWANGLVPFLSAVPESRRETFGIICRALAAPPNEDPEP